MFTHPRLGRGAPRLAAVVCLLASHLVFFASAASAAGTTHLVASAAEWSDAVAAAQPGDTIRLTATIRSRLQYRGNNDGAGTQTGRPGTASSPITITADPGVWIDPGNRANNFGALDILWVDHVHVVGVHVRNSQFGIRFMQTNGTAGSPVRIANNVVEDIGHAGIYFGGHWRDHDPSSYGLIEGNTVRRTGLSAPQYGEGVYLGHGGTEWVDRTSNVVVRSNDISKTGAEAIDIKPGTADIVVEGNYLHDISPVSGGAISAHYVNVDPNPQLSRLDHVSIRGNYIWNINLDGRAGANDWPIWVGHGGVDIIENYIWGLRADPSRVRPIRIRALQPFGPHPIRIEDNVFWTAQGWMAEGSPSGAGNVVAGGNVGFVSGGGTEQVAASHFPGPIPAIGVGGTADRGRGPGSGFRWNSSESAATPPTTPPTTAVATTAPPTTAAPTTAAPTTAAPSTAAPTTGGPTTAAPATAGPTPTSGTSTTRPASPAGGGPPVPTTGPSRATTPTALPPGAAPDGVLVVGRRDSSRDSVGRGEAPIPGEAVRRQRSLAAQLVGPADLAAVGNAGWPLPSEPSGFAPASGVELAAPGVLAFVDAGEEVAILDTPGRGPGRDLLIRYFGALAASGVGLWALLLRHWRVAGRKSS